MEKILVSITVKIRSPNEDFLKVLSAGVDIVRFKYFQDLEDYIEEKINLVQEFNEINNKKIQIQLDMPGSKIRLGELKNKKIFLDRNNEYQLINSIKSEEDFHIPINNEDFFNQIEIGDKLIFGDNEIMLEVVENRESNFYAKPVREGYLNSWKGVVISESNFIPKGDDNLIHAINFIKNNQVDWLAISFVNSSNMIEEIVNILEENNLGDVKILAKIETLEGINNIEEIVGVSDGIKIARGDLPIYTNHSLLGLHQKRITKTCLEQNKFCMVSTGAMESIIKRARPRAAEILDITNIILDGAHSIQFCEEVVGDDPVYSIEMANQIINDIYEYLER